jgi:hypothetical protein
MPDKNDLLQKLILEYADSLENKDQALMIKALSEDMAAYLGESFTQEWTVGTDIRGELDELSWICDDREEVMGDLITQQELDRRYEANYGKMEATRRIYTAITTGWIHDPAPEIDEGVAKLVDEGAHVSS